LFWSWQWVPRKILENFGKNFSFDHEINIIENLFVYMKQISKNNNLKFFILTLSFFLHNFCQSREKHKKPFADWMCFLTVRHSIFYWNSYQIYFILFCKNFFKMLIFVNVHTAICLMFCCREVSSLSLAAGHLASSSPLRFFSKNLSTPRGLGVIIHCFGNNAIFYCARIEYEFWQFYMPMSTKFSNKLDACL